MTNLVAVKEKKSQTTTTTNKKKRKLSEMELELDLTPRCDNWHDTVRLVLLRGLGVQRRDLRRWFLQRLEAIQWQSFMESAGWDYYGVSVNTFHKLAKRRAGMIKSCAGAWRPEFDEWLDAANVQQRKKNKIA